MEDSQQRKRQALDSNEEGVKRKRSNPDNTTHQGSVTADDEVRRSAHHDNDSSVEELLSVPLHIIFREVPSSAHHSSLSATRRKPLLTRAEAQCLVKTSQIAREVDVIVNMACEVLSRQRWCRSFGQSIEGVPLLRSVLPVLAVHGHVIPTRALATVQGELDHVLYELEMCASALRQYSDQNWTLSESLMDALSDCEAPGQELAKEKRKMAEIEEEVCTRIERLLGMVSMTGEGNSAETLAEDAFHQAMDSDSGQFVSMQMFCDRLLGLDVDEGPAVSAAARKHVETASIANENGGPESGSHDLRKRSTLDDDRDQWSCSTLSIRSPERHSHMTIEEQSRDGSYKQPEMTQATSIAVEALAGLASSRRGDSPRVDLVTDLYNAE